MKTIEIDGRLIVDELALHREFHRAMGFPDYYGENWNAWIDCMSCLTPGDDRMSAVLLGRDEELKVVLTSGHELRARCPELVDSLVNCAEFVNGRYLERGEGARISIVLGGTV